MAEATVGMVSVIVPTHNRAAHLQRALASVRAQTWRRLQVIVIANGCNDDTAQVAREFQRQLESESPPRIDVVFREFKESLGGARARNIGMDCAHGEYIAFLDDDDCWHPHKLAAQIELINRHDCALVGSAHCDMYGRLGGEFMRAAGRAAGDGVELRFDDLACENKLGGFSFCLTRRTTLGDSRIDEQLQALQDWDLWLKILRSGGVARISRERHVYYRIDGDGARISGRTAQVASAQRHFLRAWRGRLDARSIAYHEMRNACFQLKARAGEDKFPGVLSTWFSVIIRWPRTIQTIVRSRERGNIKRYIHYMLLPLLDIDAMRMRMWRISSKQRAHKTVTGGA